MEFAIVGGTLTALLMLAYDIGGAVLERAMLAQAVQTAGHYATAFPTQSSGVTAAISAALPSGWTNVSSNVACLCADGSTPSCSTFACPTAQRYVKVTVNRPYTLLYFNDASFSNSASHVVRVQ